MCTNHEMNSFKMATITIDFKKFSAWKVKIKMTI